MANEMAVNCPHCHQLLFKSVALHGRGFRMEAFPELQEDKGKHFMICPHEDCQKRIDLDQTETGLQISLVQKG